MVSYIMKKSEAETKLQEALAYLDVLVVAANMPDHCQDDIERAAIIASSQFSAKNPPTPKALEMVKEIVLDVKREFID